MTQGDEKFLNRKEAADFLGVTPRTVDRYVDEKRIIRYRRGIGGVFFKQTELEKLLEIKPETEIQENR